MQSLRRVFATTALAVFCAIAPAAAAGPYVFDSANLLKSETVTALNTQIGSLESATGKQVIVDIVDTTGGMPPRDFAAQEFRTHNVNGVLIFISKTPKAIGVIPDRVSNSIFPAGTTSNIREVIRSSFKSGHYDEGVTNGVNMVVSFYRSHAPAMQKHQPVTRTAPAEYGMPDHQGGGINWFLIIAIGLGIWFLIRIVTRASRGGGYYPPQNYVGGPGGYGPGPGGFGGGGFGGGGGGGFFSSLLGGLGGAFLGNELFNSMNRPNEGGWNQANMGQSNMGNGYDQPNYDQGAFQSDPGQADLGNSSFGDWGGDGGSSGSDWGGGGGNNEGW